MWGFRLEDFWTLWLLELTLSGSGFTAAACLLISFACLSKNTSVYLLSVFKTLEVLTVEAPAMEKLLQLPLGSGLKDVESIRLRGNPENPKGL